MDECHGPLVPPGHPDFSGARLLAHSILNESDRGVILVASEYLNTALEERLRLHFIDDGEAHESMLGREAPLGTFSARIAGAYALGLIDLEMRKNLDRIRRIRNYCAHHVLDVTFMSQNIRDIVWTMPLPPEKFDVPADLMPDERAALRFRFVTNVSHTAGVLDGGSKLATTLGHPRSGVGFLHLSRSIKAAPEKQGGG
jgi:DNA-binding MltR family transcriptional regulator